jgi:hypothetical protein
VIAYSPPLGDIKGFQLVSELNLLSMLNHLEKMMLLLYITIPSVEVPHFDGNDFLSWKYQMFTYLHEMNLQVW